jgi:GAF domain-containing protein
LGRAWWARRRGRKRISVTELPENYTRISSAIGEMAPVNTLVAPLIYEGKLKGVIELGTIKEFSDVEIQFIELVSVVIAAAMNSAEIRKQVEESLSISQSLTEELQSQQ